MNLQTKDYAYNIQKVPYLFIQHTYIHIYYIIICMKLMLFMSIDSTYMYMYKYIHSIEMFSPKVDQFRTVDTL